MEVFNKANANKIFVVTKELLDASSDEEEPRKERGDSQSGNALKVNLNSHQLGELLYRQ